MAHGTPLTFKLARVARGTRNVMETSEEDWLQGQAQAAREILLPGVDAATAWAFCQAGQVIHAGSNRPMIHAKRLGYGYVPHEELDAEKDPEKRQAAVDTAGIERGFAVFIHESWPKLRHLVRYFDLIEKNEAPDTPLLEWLVTAGAISPTLAVSTVARFKKRVTMGRHAFVLDPQDSARLEMAADVRKELEAEERKERADGR